MNIGIETLTKTLNMERLKKDSAFTLLSELGYTHNHGSGWEKESVFDRLKWVTFDASQDLMGVFLDSLEDGKDYKVEYIKYLKGDKGKSYILNNGIRAHESFFHSVTKEDLLPNTSVEVEPVSEDVPEWMEGFEDLIRSDYKPSHADYMVSDKLSEEQKIFLHNMLVIYSRSTFTYKGWNSAYQHFIDVSFGGYVSGKEITFNDLFIPKA